MPLADIEETDDAWNIETELPGVKADDISVDVQGDELTINGEIKERERKGVLRRRMRPVGRFELRARVPGSLDADAVEAKTDEGVLTVRIPKSQQSKARQVEVRRSRWANAALWLRAEALQDAVRRRRRDDPGGAQPCGREQSTEFGFGPDAGAFVHEQHQDAKALPGLGSLPGGRTISTARTFPSSGKTPAQFRRIVAACSSPQSIRTRLMR